MNGMHQDHLEAAEHALMVALGKTIKGMRHLRGRTQYQLARESGIDPGNLCKFENGSPSSLSLSSLLRICYAFGITIASLFRSAEEAMQNKDRIKEEIERDAL